MTGVICPGPPPAYRAGVRLLYLTSVWLHVIAAMTWIGGMVLFVAAVMPWMRALPEVDRERFLRQFGQRFGRVMWTTFAVMAVTGTANLWLRGVTVSHFLDPNWRATPFGHLIVIKVTLFLVAALLGIAHRGKISPGQARWLGRLSLVVSLLIVAAAIRLVR